MQAEIVTIGTELLLGEIIDTNAAWIAQRLTTIGLNLFYTHTVGDNLQRITDVLRTGFQRSNVVITTGGLGPTVDDMTRPAVAAATGRELVLDEDLVQEIAAYFARRGATMTDNNRRQAQLPAGATVIHNPVGTAPAFRVEEGDHVIISLPGVPHEMRYLMENEVLPYLRQRFNLRGVIRSRVLRTCGIGESAIDTRIGDLMEQSNPTVGTAAHPGQTDVRITAKADTEAEALALIEPVERELRRRLGDYIFGTDTETLADVVTTMLAERGLTLAVVETTTHGELTRQLCEGRCGSAALVGAMTFTGAPSLRQALRLSEEAAGDVFPSQAFADAAARAVRSAHGADLGLALIGPHDPARPDSPPVFFSLATPAGVIQGESRQGRAGPSGMGWLVHLGMDMVRRYLL
ncbi:MAG: CinA family nicotinamide mononucleotide deamidase-related protein [Chloroflexi bacterium]|nr:CinA family nicotinamide mononucleotide deamidase-related protein [Chloroflexota bacterium]